MQRIVVDPLLVTVPEDDYSANTRTWLLALQSWLLEIHEGDLFWYHLIQCSREIEAQKRFPDFQALRQIVQRHKLDINIGYLIRKINDFFQNEERDLMLKARTQQILAEDESAYIEPIEFLNRNQLIKTTLRDNLLRLACEASADSESRDLHFVTLPLQEQQRTLTVQCQIEMTYPDSIKDELRSCPVREEFGLLLSPVDLPAANIEELRQRIRSEPRSFEICIRRLALKNGSQTPSLFKLGSRFITSLEDSGICNDGAAFEKLIRVCAWVLTGLDKEMNLDLRPIRENEAADTAQRRRSSDRAAAFRLTITKHGIGYRLHYWQIAHQSPQGVSIEFANVVKKSDAVVIPD